MCEADFHSSRGFGGGEGKRAHRDAHFQEDLDRAKELGHRLVEQAKSRL